MESEETQQAKKPPSIAKRLNIIFFVVFLFFALLILRLSLVQIVEGEKYLQISAWNSTRTLPISAPRGMIFDRQERLLVWNRPVYSVSYIESDEPVAETGLASKLSKLIDMDANRIIKAMRAPGPKYIPKKIKSGLTEKQMIQLEERRTELPGIHVVVESLRQIAGSEENPTGTYIFGYVNSIPATSVKEYVAKGYRPTDQIGVTGLEKSYEDQLRGIDGEYEIKVNKNAETIEKRQSLSPVPGDDLYLTIDWSFQQKVEKILKDEVEQLHQKDSDIQNAIAVAMAPKTGEILALASYPNYDLNFHYSDDFAAIYNDKIKGKELNKIIDSAYPIGSTAKPLSEMMGLDSGLISPDEKIVCDGSLVVGDRTIYCWKRTGHGAITARQALQYSCNVYMYKLAMRLAEYPQKKKEYINKFPILDYYFKQFGLGTKTGIDLPGESTGWKTNTFYLGNLAYALIGQYNAYTPIQLAQYISTIANDGYRMKPYIVREVRSGRLDQAEGNRLLMQQTPQILNRVDISKENIAVVQEGMKKVTEPGGTAYYTFKGFPVPLAAKTGTAQTGSGDDNALIAGYAPYQNPEIAFVVIVPKGGHGSDTSGPIARKILEAYFHLDDKAVENE